MAKSIKAQIAELERIVLDRIQSAPVNVPVDLVCAANRREAESLLALPETKPPLGPGTIRLVPAWYTASQYLGTSGQQATPADNSRTIF